MDSLVFDTSAILNFGHRGELTALLKKLSGEYELFTTHGAQSELTDPARKKFYDAFVRDHFKVRTASTPVFDFKTLARLASTIDSGEISVMALARELKGYAVLDDRAARREAKLLARWVSCIWVCKKNGSRKPNVSPASANCVIQNLPFPAPPPARPSPLISAPSIEVRRVSSGRLALRSNPVQCPAG
jgi:predicted nucleic acid-binding protein